MVNKLVTVGRGDEAYSVLMDVEETEYDGATVPQLDPETAESMLKRELVDHVTGVNVVTFDSEESEEEEEEEEEEPNA
jgi:hypothetical protein